MADTPDVSPVPAGHQEYLKPTLLGALKLRGCLLGPGKCKCLGQRSRGGVQSGAGSDRGLADRLASMDTENPHLAKILLPSSSDPVPDSQPPATISAFTVKGLVPEGE